MMYELCIDYDNSLFCYGHLTLSELNMMINVIRELFQYFGASNYEMKIFFMGDGDNDE